jgi:AcrR family transcriptional regulator
MSVLTRESIVAAALMIWRTRGGASVTLPSVGRALGVTHAALYRYFSSADALRDTVARQAVILSDPEVVPQLITSGHPAVAGMSATVRRRFLLAATR